MEDANSKNSKLSSVAIEATRPEILTEVLTARHVYTCKQSESLRSFVAAFLHPTFISVCGNTGPMETKRFPEFRSDDLRRHYAKSVFFFVILFLL
ncbi:hypothetical protein NPIL_330341 [Nephila pilipes]|uniref:Uncharacterized protein n=1 Tax=Nephila pilipes TaxID=299642 RepID=A0A8X6QE01_NEPPI|nr:hypothetical protein NPIL_330341 [Nephila pilipes]